MWFRGLWGLFYNRPTPSPGVQPSPQTILLPHQAQKMFPDYSTKDTSLGGKNENIECQGTSHKIHCDFTGQQKVEFTFSGLVPLFSFPSCTLSQPRSYIRGGSGAIELVLKFSRSFFLHITKNTLVQKL